MNDNIWFTVRTLYQTTTRNLKSLYFSLKFLLMSLNRTVTIPSKHLPVIIIWAMLHAREDLNFSLHVKVYAQEEKKAARFQNKKSLNFFLVFSFFNQKKYLYFLPVILINTHFKHMINIFFKIMQSLI